MWNTTTSRSVGATPHCCITQRMAAKNGGGRPTAVANPEGDVHQKGHNDVPPRCEVWQPHTEHGEGSWGVLQPHRSGVLQIEQHVDHEEGQRWGAHAHTVKLGQCQDGCQDGGQQESNQGQGDHLDEADPVGAGRRRRGSARVIVWTATSTAATSPMVRTVKGRARSQASAGWRINRCNSPLPRITMLWLWLDPSGRVAFILRVHS